MLTYILSHRLKESSYNTFSVSAFELWSLTQVEEVPICGMLFDYLTQWTRDHYL